MIIGITGGAGGGKSTAARILKDKFGAEVLFADDIAKELYAPGEPAHDAVAEGFPETLCKDGLIDLKRLTEIIYGDEKRRRQLNEIVHPLVRERIEKKIRCIKAGAGRLVVIEAALLIESGYTDMCDAVAYVRCPDEIRRMRLKENRGYDDARIDAIFSSQLSDRDFLAGSDFVIGNGGGEDELKEEIKKLLNKLKIKIMEERQMKKISTDKAPAAIGPYSQAISANGFVFTSGQIPIDPETGGICGDDITAQAEQVMKNLGAVLCAAGVSYADAVKTVCFLSDIADFGAFNSVYEKYFTEKPARSCVGVKELPKGVLCEVEVIAAAKE